MVKSVGNAVIHSVGFYSRPLIMLHYGAFSRLKGIELRFRIKRGGILVAAPMIAYLPHMYYCLGDKVTIKKLNYSALGKACLFRELL